MEEQDKAFKGKAIEDVLGSVPVKKIRKVGGGLATAFYIGLKNLQLYDTNNVNVRTALTQFMEHAAQLFEDDAQVRMSAARNYLFINDVRLRGGRGGFQNYELLYYELTRRGIGAIIFSNAITEEEVERSLVIINQAAVDSAPDPSAIEQRLQATGIRTVEIEPIAEGELEIDLTSLAEEARKAAISAYFRTLYSTRDLFQEIKEGRKYHTRILKRRVQQMVDVALEGDFTLLALTRVKNHISYQVNHAINVAVLSIWLGMELGLGKMALEQLALASLFADVGMAYLPEDIQDGKEHLSEDERKIVRQHPLLGAKVVLGWGRMSEVAIRSMLVAFQHHATSDYPQLVPLEKTDLFSRIVRIVDTYDAMTTSRPFRKRPMRPEEALKALMEDDGQNYDPLLVKLLVNTMGIYPVGTMVKLSSGELGVVHRPSVEPGLVNRPFVNVLSDATGEPTEGVLLDLSQRNKAGKFARSIVATFDNTELDMEITDFLAVL